jgi:hypothetical protein
MRTTTFRRMDSAMVLAMATSLLLGGSAGAAVHVKETLRATSHAPKARGSAKLTVRRSSKGLFSIAARRLAHGASYDVVVGGIKVGALTTNTHGRGTIVFGAPKRGNRALLGFDPRGRSLAVRDKDGRDVLDGEMPDDDAGKVACCVPDDDGVECDDRTPEDCLDDGGTVSSASGCFPDPCNTTGTSVCCTVDSTCGAFVDDDPAVGCHAGVSAAECAEHHGTVVDATSCDPNPCAAVPPVELVTCCVPDDDDVECQFRTADRCAAKGGTVVTATSCDPDPCGGSAGVSSDDHQGDDDNQGDDDDQGDDSSDDSSDDGGHCGHHHHDDGSSDDGGHGGDD